MRAPVRLAAALAVAALACPASAQQLELPRPSPNAKASQFIGVTEVTVDYSSPGVKNRKIWGGVVPYDKVWRAGANSPTKLTFAKDVVIDGKPVAAGVVRLLRHSVADEVDARAQPRSEGRGRLRLQQGGRRLARRRQAAADRPCASGSSTSSRT